MRWDRWGQLPVYWTNCFLGLGSGSCSHLGTVVCAWPSLLSLQFPMHFLLNRYLCLHTRGQGGSQTLLPKKLLNCISSDISVKGSGAPASSQVPHHCWLLQQSSFCGLSSTCQSGLLRLQGPSTFMRYIV
jgi:hypothetical protein